MLLLFFLYGFFVVCISLWYKKHSTGDEFLMGDRKTSALLVAAALFTLVGGGELITLTSLSFTFGYAGISLFVGYALGFCFLALIAPKIRSGANEQLYLSLPDYAHKHFGKFTGHTVYFISFGAFFSLLMIQFTAGGQILNSFTGLSYETSILLTAAICTLYLFIGGFKTVLATDFVQGLTRLLLMPFLVYVAAKGLGKPILTSMNESLPISLWISFIITGFFSAASSADVWQRIYVAKSNKSAQQGLVWGAVLLILFGAALVALGLVAKSTGTITNPDTAFTVSLTVLLPHWAVVLAVLLVVSVIMSTADTEIFLLSGMTLREILRVKGNNDSKIISQKQSVFATRILMIIITTTAVGLALLFKDLVSIYTWLLSALLVMAPMVIFSLIVGKNEVAAKTSLILNLLLFIGLVWTNLLTPENAYLIVVPGLLIYLLVYLLKSKNKDAVV